jgi:23S rRNA (guanosine2251-2'-O)-methyltransferase
MGEKGPVIFGRHPVTEALKAGSPVQRLNVAKDAQGLPKELFETAKALDIPVTRTDKDRLDFLSGGGNHQGVVAQMGERSFVPFDTWLEEVKADKADFILALDQVQDPQNLGALLRSAEGAGCKRVLVSSAKSCGLTAAVSKASAGADQHLELGRTSKMGVALEQLRELGFQIVATFPNAEENYHEIDLSVPTVLLLGGEGRGLPPHLKRVSTHVVNIPMLGKVESLNVASSGAILLYETVRQRTK